MSDDAYEIRATTSITINKVLGTVDGDPHQPIGVLEDLETDGCMCWMTFDAACSALRILPELIEAAAERHGYTIPEDLCE